MVVKPGPHRLELCSSQYSASSLFYLKFMLFSLKDLDWGLSWLTWNVGDGPDHENLFVTTTGWWWSRPEQRLHYRAPALICASWDLLVPKSWQTLSGLARGPGSSHPATTKSDPPEGASHVRCRLLAWLSRDRKEKKRGHLNLLIFNSVYK